MNILIYFILKSRSRTLVSYNNIIMFAYHTDGQDRGSSFFGTFDFINSRIIAILSLELWSH
jgi:hypothetical protein